MANLKIRTKFISYMSLAQKIFELFKRKEKIQTGGGQKAIDKQASMGKLTARERIKTLLDPNSFHEYDLIVEHNCKDFDMDKKMLALMVLLQERVQYTGTRLVYLPRISVARGSLSLMHARKIKKIYVKEGKL